MSEIEWKPIKTAPKDGSRIVTLGGGLIGTSRWVEQFAAVYHEEAKDGWYSEQLDRGHAPTHWIPLPTPPHTKDTP